MPNVSPNIKSIYQVSCHLSRKLSNYFVDDLIYQGGSRRKAEDKVGMATQEHIGEVSKGQVVGQLQSARLK